MRHSLVISSHSVRYKVGEHSKEESQDPTDCHHDGTVTNRHDRVDPQCVVHRDETVETAGDEIDTTAGKDKLKC